MAHKPRTIYKKGTCNTICDRTGFKVKMSDVREEWTGHYVMNEDWEPRNPQDFPVTPRAQRTYPNSRSDEGVILVYTPPTKAELSQ